MKVSITDSVTGAKKEIKVGWSWTLFLFSTFLGLPLFLRKLYIWGGIFLIHSIFLLATLLIMPETLLIFILSFIFLALQIWMGIKGNEMTAKNYLERGWTFTNENSSKTQFAKGKWGIKICLVESLQIKN